MDPALWKKTCAEVFSSFEAGFGKSLASVEYNSPDWEYLQHVKYNNAVWSAFKQNKQIEDAAGMLIGENGQALPWKEFRDKAMEIDDTYNKRWLQTEYNQAHTTALQARRWKDFEKTSDLYPNLEYVAVNDERTRASHRALDGTILPITDPFWNKYSPPLDWGCRCTLRPSDADPKNSPADLPEVADGMDINPGKEAKIFSDNHPYIKGSKDRANELMQFVQSQMRSVPEIRDNYTAFIATEKGYAATFFDGNTGGMVKTHKNVLGSDLAANTGIAKAHARNGGVVKVLPLNKTGTSIDTKTNGVLNEYKSCSNTTSSIDNLLREANRQARGCGNRADVTVELENLNNKDKVKRAIMSRWGRSESLSNLYVQVNKEIYGPYTTEDIMNYRFL